MKSIEIHKIENIDLVKSQLSNLLVRVVKNGGSVGFLPPLQTEVADEYWKNVLNPDVCLWIATLDNEVVGTVQLHFCTNQNGRHRANIAKLMAHPDYRQMGVARSLMQIAEKKALAEEKTLLVLNTREGDPSNHLYRSLGYVEVGEIPGYLESANREFHATVFYYKTLK